MKRLFRFLLKKPSISITKGGNIPFDVIVTLILPTFPIRYFVYGKRVVVLKNVPILLARGYILVDLHIIP
jgi:hypothetical protein